MPIAIPPFVTRIPRATAALVAAALAVAACQTALIQPPDAEVGSCPGAWCKSVALYAAPGG